VSDGSDDGFLARWSRRKAALREGRPLAPEPAPVAVATPVEPSARAEPAAPASDPVAAPARGEAPPAPPPPTLDDVAGLSRDSDFRRFVAADVDPSVKNAALKKLFADPQFNVMDGLDVYIDDYGKPDPLPASMLRKMVQSAALGLFDDEGEKNQLPPPQTAPTESSIRDDQDPAVRLQPDDAAGPAGAAGGTGEDSRREC
jgi:hypothetical protein